MERLGVQAMALVRALARHGILQLGMLIVAVLLASILVTIV